MCVWISKRYNLIMMLLMLFQYGDDYDEDSDRPVSVLKEHTVFTDTYV